MMTETHRIRTHHNNTRKIKKMLSSSSYPRIARARTHLFWTAHFGNHRRRRGSQQLLTVVVVDLYRTILFWVLLGPQARECVHRGEAAAAPTTVNRPCTFYIHSYLRGALGCKPRRHFLPVRDNNALRRAEQQHTHILLLLR